MRHTKRLCLTVWAILGIAGLEVPHQAHADEYVMAVTGSYAIPSHEMQQFTDNRSIEGGTLDLRHLRWNSLSWGVSAGLNVLSFRSNDPTDIGDLTIGGGDQYRWINTIPFYVTAHWYPIKSSTGLTLYLGGGIGPMRAIRRVEVGWTSGQEDSWHLSGAPEIGVLIPLGMDWKFLAKAQYHYALDNGDSWGPRYLALGFGLAEF